MMAVAPVEALGTLADVAAASLRPFAWLLTASTIASIIDRALAPVRTSAAAP